MLGEYGADANEVYAEFIWMSPEVGDSGLFGGDDGLGGYMPLAVAANDNGGVSQLSWVHGNHMGVPAVYTDASGSEIAMPAGYSAPGFPGQSRTLADLYYNRYRDYDPTTGRYIQADPIGLAGGPSPYSYAMNNPLRYIDPTGEAVPLILIGVGIGIGIEFGFQAADNWFSGRDIFNLNCYEWGEIAVAGGLGAFGGNWVKGWVTLTKGSMKWNNASRRIRRAEKMVGGPDDLHHWAVPRRAYERKPWENIGNRAFNRPWNLNPVNRNFHQKTLNQMSWPRALINGAPRSVQAAVGLGLGGVGIEMSDGGWE